MSSPEIYNICSLSNCDFSTTDMTDEKCGKCGSDLITECPQCSEYINQGTNVFCTKCGASLKAKSVYEERGLRSLSD